MTARYIVRYLCDGYILADAFRPQTKWGEKSFSVNAKDLSPHTDGDLIAMAQDNAPDGYWLQRITAFEEGERVVYSKQVPSHPSAYARYHQSGASGFHQATVQKQIICKQ